LLVASAARASDTFGSDVSVGYGGGALLGAWPDAGIHGFVHARLDAFTVGRDRPGPRLGASIWAAQTLFPLQYAREEDDRFQFGFSQYGVLAVLRHDPAAPVGADFGFGFGRIDLANYWSGPHALPTLSFEVGPRIKAADTAFVDVLTRVDWATALGPEGVLDEWWGVSLQLGIGMHVQ
jgi:hypothetical protein